MDTLIPGKIVGNKYQLLGEIDHGGFGLYLRLLDLAHSILQSTKIDVIEYHRKNLLFLNDINLSLNSTLHWRVTHSLHEVECIPPDSQM